MIDTLLEVVRLKALDRAGWVRRGVPAPESVAAHSWGVAWLVLMLLPDDLDRDLALAYATVHDLPEVRVGDLTPSDGVSTEDKHHRELRALHDLLEPGGRGSRIRDLWQDYEAQRDPESRFVRQLDRLDMALQAVVYGEEHDLDLGEFLDSAETTIVHPTLVGILDGCRKRLERKRA